MPLQDHHIYIVDEIPHVPTNQHKLLHRFPVTEKNRYRETIAINAFNSGKRYGATKRDTEIYHNTCGMGPRATYIIRSLELWKQDRQITINAITKVGKVTTAEAIQNLYGIQVSTLEELTFIDHKSIWDFFATIRFDHKRRCYLDENGNILRY